MDQAVVFSCVDGEKQLGTSTAACTPEMLETLATAAPLLLERYGQTVDIEYFSGGG